MFSPNGAVRARIISEINKAQSSIDIAIYNFTTDELRDALVAARNRGVAIRVVADSTRADDPYSKIGYLESRGFSVKRSAGVDGGVMYNKYMIIDGKLLLTGSYNWSANAEENSFGNALFVRGSPVVRKFIEDFEKIWAR
jgi:phosphatidylserine/phosphatidylglycerophosphate/cardiolipin synthase-like enzyme